MQPIPPDRPVRWGVLGAGGIAATTLPDIVAVPGNEVVAVAARDGARAAQFARRFQIPRSYGSYAELAADAEVDVVYIATTHAQHYEQALACIAAGRSVLVEKAFTLNARQAREIAAAAEAAGVFCMEAMWLRFNALLGIAVQAAGNGAIGDVQGVRAELCRRFDYNPSSRFYDLTVGGGALLDLGVYPINFAWMFLGAPQTVAATGGLAPTGADDSVALQFGYPDGGFSQLACSMRARTEPVSLVVGTDGWIEVHGAVHHPDRLVIRTASQTVEHDAPTSGGGYQPQFAEVNRCLREGATQSRIMPLADTVAILDVIDGVRADLGVRYPADELAGPPTG